MQSFGIKIYRGSTSPLIWRFKNADSLFNLTGSRLILSISLYQELLIRKDSSVDASAVIDLVAATFTWTPEPEESRLVPVGRDAAYEIERWIGGAQSLLARGYVEGIGGLNSD